MDKQHVALCDVVDRQTIRSNGLWSSWCTLSSQEMTYCQVAQSGEVHTLWDESNNFCLSLSLSLLLANQAMTCGTNLEH